MIREARLFFTHERGALPSPGGRFRCSKALLIPSGLPRTQDLRQLEGEVMQGHLLCGWVEWVCEADWLNTADLQSLSRHVHALGS